VTKPPSTIGVAGAGTMGAGIAQLGCQSGARTLLYDPDPEALRRGGERIVAALRRAVERGRLTQAQCTRATANLEQVTEPAGA
jgi:3-hydroxybutyryl-CoA dehydrogenase